MRLEINGQPVELHRSRTVAEMVVELGLTPELVLIEHNRTALLRSEWNKVQLAESDRVEILRVAAGG